MYIIMTYINPADCANYQRTYRLTHQDYFASYRAGKGDYFLEKKREWAKQNPNKSAEYGRRCRLWKSVVSQLSSIDIENL